MNRSVEINVGGSEKGLIGNWFGFWFEIDFVRKGSVRCGFKWGSREGGREGGRGRGGVKMLTRGRPVTNGGREGRGRGMDM